MQLVVSGFGYPRTQRVGILSDLVRVTRLKGTEWKSGDLGLDNEWNANTTVCWYGVVRT